MKKMPRKLAHAVRQIGLSSKNPRKLQDACGRYKDIFAVYPNSLDMLPKNAKNLILSHDSFEEALSHSIPITTPAELQKFYK